jgi:hypothetical protein
MSRISQLDHVILYLPAPTSGKIAPTSEQRANLSKQRSFCPAWGQLISGFPNLSFRPNVSGWQVCTQGVDRNQCGTNS